MTINIYIHNELDGEDDEEELLLLEDELDRVEDDTRLVNGIGACNVCIVVSQYNQCMGIPPVSGHSRVTCQSLNSDPPRAQKKI